MAMALGACSTVGGLGKDITATAEWSKEKMSVMKKTSIKG